MAPRRKGLAVGFVTSAYNLGGLVGPPAVTFALVNYAWNGSFVTFSIVGLIGLLLFYVILGRRDEVRSPSPAVSPRTLSRNKTIMMLVLADFVADLGFLAYVSWTPLVGTLVGIGIGLGGVGALIAGTLFDRLGGRVAILGRS